ncbi:STAS domain-containing protein [Fictibacillus norfolkensis]|uniref:STAS domain-containing protein n=1 Tax=Fictibacillus norfolkensis TaxID=2762233 RepID=A0ABR8SHF2_9BACL|nr:STAS domain-containing protein [Fictibacillus norfolkensis]MBD7962922.1 STAS domain-containing protein [Fictibacillus norfolkensis]
MAYELEETIKDTLNCLEENIFYIEQDFHISWMNSSGKKLIEMMKTYLNIDSAEDILGLHIRSFHKSSFQEELMKKGEFPIDMQIVLFNRFVARLIVKELIVQNQKRGYLLTWKDITEREQERERTKEMLNELATPILQTIANHTLLVPLIGELTLERLETLTTKLLKECLNNGADYVILDFSGVTTITDPELGHEIQKLTDTIKLLGADVLYCGFPKEMVKNMVSLGLHTNQLSFASFRNAIRHVVSELQK